MRGLTRALMLAALAPAWTAAADKPPDSDLLEFLGSVDAEGNGWSEYLERTNLDKVSKAPVAKKPATAPPATKPVKAASPPPAAANRPGDAK